MKATISTHNKYMNDINCFDRIVSQTRKEQIINTIHRISTIDHTVKVQVVLFTTVLYISANYSVYTAL